jgi:hypothetical protein
MRYEKIISLKEEELTDNYIKGIEYPEENHYILEELYRIT